MLGGADGVTSIAGVIAGGTAAHVAHNALAVTVLGGALASTESMAGAEWLAEGETEWPAVGMMAAGTLVGSALPAIPLFLGAGWWAVALVALGLSIVVGEVRHRMTGRNWWVCQAQTLGILVLGGLLGYGAGRFL